MVIRIILNYLARNEHLINKLADSRPMRRAAQLCVYMIHKSHNIRHTYRFTDNPRELANQIMKITQRFSDNFKKELEAAKKEAQEKKPK